MSSNELRSKRTASGKTQMQIAIEAGVSLATIQGLESGRTKYVLDRLASRIAPAYGVPIESIPTRPVHARSAS